MCVCVCGAAAYPLYGLVPVISPEGQSTTATPDTLQDFRVASWLEVTNDAADLHTYSHEASNLDSAPNTYTYTPRVLLRVPLFY